MLKVAQARKIILKGTRFLCAEKIGLTASLWRILAEDIYARVDVPPFDNSAMDGYALRWADSRGASKNSLKILTVIGELRAGEISNIKLARNQALRIMTGAPIPPGADSVIMVEQTTSVVSRQSSVVRKNELIRIFREVKNGENIRRKSEDIRKGELVIPKGTRLGPAQIGILASLGKARVKVSRKPRVALLASGDELAGLGERLSAGKIRNSNTYALYAKILHSGGIPENLGIVPDDAAQLEKKIKAALVCDLVVISGGVSVGKYDLVKDVLARIGARIKFWQVAMRPGKPVVFSTMKNKPIFGLPGNPVSAMITFDQFVRPAILKMSGQKNNDKNRVSAILEEDLDKKPGARYFLRAKTRWYKGAYFTRRSGPQGSSLLKPMALANSLIILPEEQGPVRKGARVPVQFLD